MKKSTIVFIIFLLVFAYFSTFVSLPQVVRAGNFLDLNEQEGFVNNEIPGAYGESDKPTDIRNVVINIVQAILGLLAIIFLILVIYAGFKWMTAAGNEEKVKDARGLLIQAVIGLIIIMSAWGITLFVLKITLESAGGFWNF